MSRDPLEILAAKRDGLVLSPEEIRSFVERYVANELEDYHAAVLLTSIFIRGMTSAETHALTSAMLDSGDRFRFDDFPTADKHSTGGVGDKVSLPLAPAVAACGVHVPMISGRGLGHTGGTLDKLESIPGFSTRLTEERFTEAVRRFGLAFAGQTDRLVPADKRLYALRDATGLVAAIPLIASSIMSKKLAEGLDALVLDIKTGTGAFLPEASRGLELGRAMCELGDAFGLKAQFFLTAMDRPLGFKIGNALEVEESIDCLRGSGPRDLRELVQVLGGAMLVAAGVADDEFEARTRIGASLDDGSAMQRWLEIVEFQGGDPKSVLRPEDQLRAPEEFVVEAERDGVFVHADVCETGRAVVELGGGRRRVSDEIDPRVGLELLVEPNEAVRRGQPLVRILHANHGLDAARARLAKGITVADPSDLSDLGPLIVQQG